MKRRIVAVLSCCAVAAWSWSRPVAAAPEPQDTTLPGVIARVQFASSGDGVLRVGIVFHNDNDHAADAGGRPFRFADFTMVDAKANRKSFAIKDANGKYVAGPVSDWNDGGRWFAAVAAKSETLVWAWFEDVAPGTKIALQVPLVGEMDVVVAPRVAVPPTSVPNVFYTPLQASVRSVMREDNQLRVKLLLGNAGDEALRGMPAVAFEDVYAFDTTGKRKYPLLKDADGAFLALPKSDANHGGRLFLSEVRAHGQLPLSLTFQAPPDSVRQVDIVVPLFVPLAAVPIVGEGGADEGGVAAAGRSAELERIKKEIVVAETPKTMTLRLPADVLFDFDQATLKPEAVGALRKFLAVLSSAPYASLVVEGHTDAKGTDSYNDALSARRARAVADWLISNGVDAAKLATHGYGRSKPIADNTKADGSDDPEGRARNRRVEIVVTRAP